MKTNTIYIADTSAMEYKPGPIARTWRRQFYAALRLLAIPEGPAWLRFTYWWVATPSGLFANFFCWFAGVHFWGLRFFVAWQAVAMFAPSATIYYRNAKKAEQEAKEREGA